MDLSSWSVEFWGPRCKMVSLVSGKVSESPDGSENPVSQPMDRFGQTSFSKVCFLTSGIHFWHLYWANMYLGALRGKIKVCERLILRILKFWPPAVRTGDVKKNFSATESWLRPKLKITIFFQRYIPIGLRVRADLVCGLLRVKTWCL